MIQSDYSSVALMRLKVLLPHVYLGLATYVWIDFMRLPPDGLANLGLIAANGKGRS